MWNITNLLIHIQIWISIQLKFLFLLHSLNEPKFFFFLCIWTKVLVSKYESWFSSKTIQELHEIITFIFISLPIILFKLLHLMVEVWIVQKFSLYKETWRDLIETHNDHKNEGLNNINSRETQKHIIILKNQWV